MKTKTNSEAGKTSQRLAILIATACGIGFIPKAPGTAGSLAGVFVYMAIEVAGLGRIYPHVIILLLVAGLWAAGRVQKVYGHDSPRIVIDEMIGQMITFCWIGRSVGREWFILILMGFGLFRFLDILKPFPIRHLERLGGGAGVVADDVAAGVGASLPLGLLAGAF